MTKCRTIHNRKTGCRWKIIHASNSKGNRVQGEEILLKRICKTKTSNMGTKCKIKLDTKVKRWT